MDPNSSQVSNNDIHAIPDTSMLKVNHCVTDLTVDLFIY